MAEQTQKQQILTRMGHLESERASWFAHWQELTTYLLPRQGRYFVGDRNKGWKRHSNIFDNTGTRAAYTLQAGLMGGLTSPARPWFRLGVQEPELMKHPEVKRWLSQATMIMLDIFQKSNVYRVLPQMYLELGVFGTAAAIVAEDFDTVIHLFPLTAGEYCIAQDWKGRVDTLYRRFEKTVADLVLEFGKENCSNSVQQMFDRGQLDKWVTVIHAIEPRKVRDYTKADDKNMAWRSVYYEVGGDPNKPLRESGYKRFVVLAPRWDVSGGDVYGNSPGMEALGDIKQLQQEQLRKSQGIDYQTNPPLQLPTNLKNRDVDRLPGGITFRDSSGNGDKIETMFDVQLDLGALREDIMDVRQRIRASFYADMFLMLQQDSQDTRKTATEVAELHEEKMLMLGPVLERLHNELLSPLIDITFDRMIETGIVPVPPEVLHGQPLNVELVSMLAQAQRAIATNGVDRFVQNMGMIAQFKPEVLDKFDADYWADNYSDMLGVDPQMVVPEDKVLLVRQQRAQMQQAAQQSALANQKADTVQKLGGTPTQGGNSTALQDVTNLFSQGLGAPQTQGA